MKSGRKVAQAVGQTSGNGPPDAVANLPWGHNVLLFEKIKDQAQRLWYAAKTLEHGWSRAVLTVQIESDLFGRKGKAVTNFPRTLSLPQSDLAQQSLKDPYLFDFLTLHAEAVERDLETGLVEHIQKFLLELGAGFAFVGRQVHIVVGEEDFTSTLVDESHRGQYGEMHAKMHKAVPNACFIGFTGTPVMKKEKNTVRQFGGMSDTYTIRQAVEDEAVVPLLYEG